jgi:hypothetical protein
MPNPGTSTNGHIDTTSDASSNLELADMMTHQNHYALEEYVEYDANVDNDGNPEAHPHEHYDHPIDNDYNHEDEVHDDKILHRCYVWSFLFQTCNHRYSNDPIDSEDNEDNGDESIGEAIVTPSTERHQQPTRRHNTTATTTTSKFVLLLTGAIIFTGIWFWGIHSMIQVQNTLLTDFGSLFQVSNRHNTTGIVKSNHSHTRKTISSSFSSTLPIIIVLSTSGLDTATTMSTSRTIGHNDTGRCVSTSKISRRGTVQYKHGHDFTTGLEQYLVDRLKNETAQSQQQHQQPNNNTTVLVPSNDTNSTTTSTPLFRMSSYFSYMSDGLEWLARNEMATPDGTSVLVQIQYSNNGMDMTTFPEIDTPTTIRSDYQLRRCLITAIDEFIDQFYYNYDSKNLTTPLCVTIQPTGMPYLEIELSQSIHRLNKIVVHFVLPAVIVAISFLMWYSYHANYLWIWIIPFAIITMTVSLVCIMIQHIMIPYMPSYVSIFTPLIMMTTSVATSSIQTILLLSRYLEEMDGMVYTMINSIAANRTSSPSRAVRRMLKSSGSILISTGLIYMLVLLIFWIGTVSVLLQSLLVGILLVITLTSGVTIGMMATLLKHTPLGSLIVDKKRNSISPTSGVGYEIDDLNRYQSDGEHIELNRHLILHEPSHNLLAESFVAQMLPNPRKSIWFCLARNIVHPYRAIILILVIFQAVLPVAFHSKRIHLSYQPMNMISTHNKITESYITLGRHIGYGRLYPYRIVFDGRASNTSMTSKASFAMMHSVINGVQSQNLIPLSFHSSLEEENLASATDSSASLHRSSFYSNHATQLKYDMFNGIAIAENTIVSYDMFLAAKYCAPPTRTKNFCPFELLRAIAATNEQMTSNDTLVTYTQVELGIDPFSSEGIKWLRNTRNKIDHFRLAGNSYIEDVVVDIGGSGGLVYDSVVSLYKPIHQLILLSVVMIAIFLTIFFRSLLLPIRSVSTIGLTVSFSLGLAVAVYQHGILNWTRIVSLQSNSEDEGLYCLVPILAFPMIVGFSLFFDAVLLFRILEFREYGYEHKSSVALGLDTVGGCNTCCGVTIAIIFSAILFFGENRMLQQWSLVIISAVLLDTFVIRTMVVPLVISSSTGTVNWWPRRLPQEIFCLEAFNFRNPLQVDDSIDDNPSNYWEALVASSEYEPLRHNR